MKKILIIASVILALLAITPFVFIARARSRTATKPRLHLLLDMDAQDKFMSQQTNSLYVDGRSMRLPVANTLAVEDVRDSVLATGKMDNEWITVLPVAVTDELMHRGQQRYNVYCAPCHGLSGQGNGPIAQRADQLAETESTTWIPPTPYHSDTVRQRPLGHLFNTISNGIRTMPSYRAQIVVEDRWAIVAYLQALLRSQNAVLDDVPAEMRQALQ